jgi:hypothetical protein
VLNQGEWIRVYKNQALAAQTVDKSSYVRNALRAAEQAVYEVLYRRLPGSSKDGKIPTGGGTGGDPGNGGGDGSGGDSGDHGKPPPPPPPPPPH